jgi:hypothetical protein
VVDFTNPSFFKLFNFPLIEGSNDLTDQSAVLITEKTAEKYFGQESTPSEKPLLFLCRRKFRISPHREGCAQESASQFNLAV